MFQRLSRMATAVMLLSAVAVFAWAEGRTPKKDVSYEKNGCCADACAREACDGEEGSPTCTDACPGTDPCEASTTSECGTGCAAATCTASGCCKKTEKCAGCCTAAVKVSEGCCACCKTAAVKVSEGCCAGCKAVATKVSEACCACCKGECPCSQKKTVSTGCACVSGKACCAAAAPVSACCACCKAAAVTVSEVCCACCKGECPCSKKEAVGCYSGKGCCAAATKASACCACCKAAAAVTVSDGCCACCKGECPCSKKVGQAMPKCDKAVKKLAGRLQRAPFWLEKRVTYVLSSDKGVPLAFVVPNPGLNLEPYVSQFVSLTGSIKYRADVRTDVMSADRVQVAGDSSESAATSPVVPIIAPRMVMPAATPVPFIQVPMVPCGPCVPPSPGGLDHSTYNMPMPCPGMPMPCPMPYTNVAYGYPTACPNTCPMPQPVGVALTPASEPKQYEVCVKLIDCKPGRDDRVVSMPRLTVVEGEPGRCTVGSEGCAGSLRVRVDRTASDKVSVGVRLSKRSTCYESEGSVVTCQSCSTVRTVTLTETVRVALCKTCADTACGKSGKWLEIQVKDLEATTSVAAPKAFHTPRAIAQYPMGGLTYPPTPPSTICPPAPPVAPAAPELVRCAAAEPKCESTERVVHVASDGSLQMRSDDCTVRGTSMTLQVKGTTLTLRSDEMKGRKRVCVEADCDLEAVADKMTVAADGRLILEGEVHILCASPSSGMAERVEAGRVILEVESGKMKCIQVVHDKP